MQLSNDLMFDIGDQFLLLTKTINFPICHSQVRHPYFLLVSRRGLKRDGPKRPFVLASPLFRYLASAPGAALYKRPVPRPRNNIGHTVWATPGIKVLHTVLNHIIFEFSRLL